MKLFRKWHFTPGDYSKCLCFLFLVVAGGLIRSYCHDLKADLVTGSVQEVFRCVLLLKGKWSENLIREIFGAVFFHDYKVIGKRKWSSSARETPFGTACLWMTMKVFIRRGFEYDMIGHWSVKETLKCFFVIDRVTFGKRSEAFVGRSSFAFSLFSKINHNQKGFLKLFDKSSDNLRESKKWSMIISSFLRSNYFVLKIKK